MVNLRKILTFLILAVCALTLTTSFNTLERQKIYEAEYLELNEHYYAWHIYRQLNILKVATRQCRLLRPLPPGYVPPSWEAHKKRGI